MIRKITTLCITLLICITLTACGSAAPASDLSTSAGDQSSVIESINESISESKYESVIESKAGLSGSSKVESETESKAASKIVSKTETESKITTTSKTESTTESKVESKAETVTESKVESMTESKAESKVENNSESKSESTDTQTDTVSVVSETEQSEPIPVETNILVVYFSRTGEQYGVGIIDEGNTAIVAKMIAEQMGADTFEILPTDDHYPMTYDALTDVAKQEQNENARPGYQGGVPELSKYDTIFIGAPVWWGDWPMIMYTFFENEDLSGKTLIPFSTHAGSGLSGFDRKLSNACPASTVFDGLAVAGTDAQNDREKVRNDVISWLSGLNY